MKRCYAYDFDGTIYNGDSSIDFYFYTFFRRPYIIILWPIQLLYVFLYFIGFISKTRMKEIIFSFLRLSTNKEKLIENFWNKNYKKIKPWYLEKKHSDDIIISASPEFLLEIPCKKLKVKDLIASEVDIKNGKFLSNNCYGPEKVRRYKKKYLKYNLLEMYTDSRSDKPMIDLAKKGYMVKKDKIYDFNDYIYKKK